MLEGCGIKHDQYLKVMGSMEYMSTPERIISDTLEKFGQIDILVNKRIY